MRWIPSLFAVLLMLLLAAGAAAQEPSLPQGLSGGGGGNATGEGGPESPSGLGPSGGDNGGPGLPSGLEPEGKADAAPSLPQGLGTEQADAAEREGKQQGASLPFRLSGFAEVRGGARVTEDPHQKDASLGEARLQLEGQKYWGSSSLQVKADLLYDPVLGRHDVDLEKGEGVVDLRQALFSTTPLSFLDVKVGRQVLTWGTGNFIFINDLFPKDWRSFFIGRDVEYLKAPSDAAKASLYTPLVNADVVYTPKFDPDRFIDGRRLSYWNPQLGRLAGRDDQIDARRPDDWFEDDELALRLFRNLFGYELAAYGYTGFWKSPAGRDRKANEATFPELSVVGASARGSLGPGIANLELGYYASEEDGDGDDPLVRNSELRVLLGYEWEAAESFTVGLQYYLEHMMDHKAYERALPPGQNARDENRHVLTLDLRKQLLMQTLELSLFTFYSPTDRDAYFRPRATYDLTDEWTLSGGLNIFVGEDEHTFFGQFENNSNVYAALRYSF